VDRFYEAFVSDVARNRGVDASYVKQNFGKGGRVMAEEAAKVGMIDGVLTIEELISKELTTIAQEIARTENKAFLEKSIALLNLED
jgi:ClpP class serine protease